MRAHVLEDLCCGVGEERERAGLSTRLTRELMRTSLVQAPEATTRLSAVYTVPSATRTSTPDVPTALTWVTLVFSKIVAPLARARTM